MKVEQTCFQCSKKLKADEKALCKKYLAPGQERLCLDHLALYLRVERAILEEKIEALKDAGCPLFGGKK